MNKSRLLGVMLVTAFLAGCAGKETKNTADVDDQSSSDTAASSQGDTMPDTTGVDSSGSGFQGESLDDPNSILANRTIYFELDSSKIPYESQAIIEAHASYLANNPNVRITVEGHADERGSREYNIGLGERRALAVSRMMELSGASEGQMSVISYGEEKPLRYGHDEASWASNRRVELDY